MGNRNFRPASVPAGSRLKLGTSSAAPKLLLLPQITCSSLEILVGTSSPGTSSSFKEEPRDGDTCSEGDCVTSALAQSVWRGFSLKF